jgi:hypothetical protein
VGSYADLEPVLLQAEIGTHSSRPDLLAQVTNHLSSPASGRWILVVDGVNDESVFFDTPREDLFFAGSVPTQSPSRTRLIHYLPYSRLGTIIFTARSSRTGCRLIGSSNVIEVAPLDLEDAEAMLCYLLKMRSLEMSRADQEAAPKLVKCFECLPLSISLGATLVALGAGSVSDLLESYNGALENWLRAECKSLDSYEPIEKPKTPPGLLFGTRALQIIISHKASFANELLLMASAYGCDSIPSMVVQRLSIMRTDLTKVERFEIGEKFLQDLGVMNDVTFELDALIGNILRQSLKQSKEYHEGSYISTRYLIYQVVFQNL